MWTLAEGRMERASVVVVGGGPEFDPCSAPEPARTTLQAVFAGKSVPSFISQWLFACVVESGTVIKIKPVPRWWRASPSPCSGLPQREQKTLQFARSGL